MTVNNEGYRVFRKKTTKKEDTKKESKASSTNTELLNLVRRTIRGDFGNGKNRKQILGSNYDKVQYQVEQNLKHKTTSWDKIKLY